MNLNELITQDMKDHFYIRTNKHIDLVGKYLKKCIEENNSISLNERIESHDFSKFIEPLLTPYILISWNYKVKNETGNDCEWFKDIKEEITKATLLHCKSERHHPEHHTDQEDVINKYDRDKPSEIMVDATKMNTNDVIEMVCDWCAMSEERGNTPYEWAEKNVNIRWKFTEEQEKLIYETMDKIWEDK